MMLHMAPSGGDHSSHARRPCRRTLPPPRRTHGGPVRWRICGLSTPSIVGTLCPEVRLPTRCLLLCSDKWWCKPVRYGASITRRPLACVLPIFSFASQPSCLFRGAIAGQLTVLSFVDWLRQHTPRYSNSPLASPFVAPALPFLPSTYLPSQQSAPQQPSRNRCPTRREAKRYPRTK